MRAERPYRLATLILLTSWMAACGIPRDPQDSLRRITQTRVLRAGFTVHEPWVRYSGGATPEGPEADLVAAFGESLGARVEWQRGSETQLFEALRTFELDIAIGGFDQDNPWASEVGTTRAYVEHNARRHVIALPPGENRLVTEFERMLRARAPAMAAAVGGKHLS